MRVADLNHRLENGGPSMIVLEHTVREHAPIPAYMLDASLLRILEPISRASDDVELAIGVIGRTMLAGLVM